MKVLDTYHTDSFVTAHFMKLLNHILSNFCRNEEDGGSSFCLYQRNLTELIQHMKFALSLGVPVPHGIKRQMAKLSQK
jgi:hypothetical protein